MDYQIKVSAGMRFTCRNSAEWTALGEVLLGNGFHAFDEIISAFSDDKAYVVLNENRTISWGRLSGCPEEGDVLYFDDFRKMYLKTIQMGELVIKKMQMINEGIGYIAIELSSILEVFDILKYSYELQKNAAGSYVCFQLNGQKFSV